MLSVQKFRDEINSEGVLRTNRFDVSIYPTGKNIDTLMKDYNSTGVYGNKLTLRCEDAQLPGINFATVDAVRLGYGGLQTTPYAPTFDDITLTFIVDAKSRLYNFFYQWTNLVVNYNGQGASRLDSKNKYTSNKVFEVGYREDYEADIVIRMYKETGKKRDVSVQVGDNPPSTGTTDLLPPEGAVGSSTITLYRAFPKAFPTIPISWNTEGEVMRVQIPFGYSDFNVKLN